MISFKDYLTEMGETSKGRNRLAALITDRVQKLAANTAADALSAGNPLKHDNQTVIGLDPATKEPIYNKAPKFRENKQLQSISRATARLAK